MPRDRIADFVAVALATLTASSVVAAALGAIAYFHG